MLTLLADVVWPALFLEARLLAWWVILTGLLVEWPFVRLLTHFSWKKAFIANVAMNAASTIIGIILLPIAGIGWEFIGEPLFITASRSARSIPSLGGSRFYSPFCSVLRSNC